MPRHKHRSSLRRQRPHAAARRVGFENLRIESMERGYRIRGLWGRCVCGSANLRYAKRRSLSELLTTETLLNAIAPAATMGFRSPAAASGIAATL